MVFLRGKQRDKECNDQYLPLDSTPILTERQALDLRGRELAQHYRRITRTHLMILDYLSSLAIYLCVRLGVRKKQRVQTWD